MTLRSQTRGFFQEVSQLIKTGSKEAAGLAKLLLERAESETRDVTELSEVAREHLERATELYAELEISSEPFVAQLLGLAELYADLSDPEAAWRCLERALDTAQVLGHRSLQIKALHGLAGLALKATDFRAGRMHYEAALELSREADDPDLERLSLTGLAELARFEDNYARAAELYTRRLELARDSSQTRLELEGLEDLGKLHLAFAEPEQALPHLHEALELARQLVSRDRLTAVHAHLADCYEALGDYQLALEHHRAFHRALENMEARKAPEPEDLEMPESGLVSPGKLPQLFERQAQAEAERLAIARTAELEEAQLDAVTRLAVAAEYRDDATGEHTRRVGRNAAALAFALGWDEEETERIYVAARLHDVGKIGVSDLILHKAGKLTQEEFDAMKVHTTIGAEILAAGKSDLLRMAEEIALSHHERWDGKGYPYGLAGQDIPMAARIVAVADVLDALTHVRPYKPAWPVEEALSEIERGSGTQFDPQVVKACTQVFGFRKLSPTEFEDELEATLDKLEALILEVGV